MSGFLALLGPEERRSFAAAGQPRLYHRGDVLFLEGARSDTVYLVVEGQARVFTVTAEGNEVTLNVRGPGDLIGEMSALDPGSLRSATVVALDTLRCRVITSTQLQGLLEAHPRAAVALVRLLIGRLRQADRRRTEFGSYDATRRLARILVEAVDEAEAARGGATVGLALSQRELAGLIGASRESVARALAELRRRNLVDTGRRAITIRDLVALRHYAA